MTEDVEFRRVDDLLAVLDAFGAGAGRARVATRRAVRLHSICGDHPDRVAALVQLASGIGGLEVPMSPRDEEVEQRYEEVDQAATSKR
jgi:hypothetical protein